MLFLLGISLLGTVGSRFVPANSVHNISIETTNDRVEWTENGNTILLLSYDSNADGCGPHPKNPKFNGYCINKGKTYVLEILNTSNHHQSVFTGNQEICTIDYSASVPKMIYSSTKQEEVTPIHIEMIVLLTKPKPNLKLTLNATDLLGNITVKEIDSCGDPLTNYTISYDLYISKVRDVFQRDDIPEFSVIAYPYYGDLEDEYFGPASTPTIIKTAVPDPECCCCPYNLTVIIIKSPLIVLVIIVVIIHCCRREAKKCEYWTINIILISGIVVGVILVSVQIVYLTDESDDSCKKTCEERTGCNAAIVLIVVVVCKNLVCIVVVVKRFKNRDQKKGTSDTEMKLGSENMKPGSEKEKNGTSDRPLPEPKRTSS